MTKNPHSRYPFFRLNDFYVIEYSDGKGSTYISDTP